MYNKNVERWVRQNGNVYQSVDTLREALIRIRFNKVEDIDDQTLSDVIEMHEFAERLSRHDLADERPALRVEEHPQPAIQ